MIAESMADLEENLKNRISKPMCSNQAPRITFVFTGQGAAWYAMGRELLKYDIFREVLQEAENHLQTFGCNWSIQEELHRDELASKVSSPAISQPICTALQIALVELLRSWEIYPTMAVGHSSGKIGAAYAASGLSLESALMVAYHRSTLHQRLTACSRERGAITSVALSEAEFAPFLSALNGEYGKSNMRVGCINSPQNATLTGFEESVDALMSIMDQNQIFCRKLNVGVAYHSRYMDDIALEYENLIQYIHARDGPSDSSFQPAMISSVSGEKVSTQNLNKAEYWVENMVSLV